MESVCSQSLGSRRAIINKVFALRQCDLYSKDMEDIHKAFITADSALNFGWSDPLQWRMLKKQVGLKS
jgi:hypothetical protein